MNKLGVVAHTCNLSHQRITVNSRQVWATKLETASEKEEEKSEEGVKKEEEKGKRWKRRARKEGGEGEEKTEKGESRVLIKLREPIKAE